MCYWLRIRKDRELAQISAYGRVNILELKEIFLETVRHEDWRAGFNMLCDYRKIEKFDVTSKEIDEMTEWQASIDTLIGSGRCAVVATRDFVFGMNRMWELLSADRPQQIKVFRKVREAVSWLFYPVMK